jgi:predicted transposase YdaD
LPQIKRVYLEDFEYSTEPAYGLLRLIACSPDDTVTLAQTLAQESDKLDQEIIEFKTVLVYKLPNLSREEIRIMLGLNDVKLKETRFYQEIAEEERREGRLEGILEGKLEGKLEGRQEGERLFLIKLLGKRFGPIPDWVQPKLEKADIEQLECWGERILEAQSLADVFESD